MSPWSMKYVRYSVNGTSMIYLIVINNMLWHTYIILMKQSNYFMQYIYLLV